MEQLHNIAEQTHGISEVVLDLASTEYSSPAPVEATDAAEVTLGGAGLYGETGLNSKHS